MRNGCHGDRKQFFIEFQFPGKPWWLAECLLLLPSYPINPPTFTYVGTNYQMHLLTYHSLSILLTYMTYMLLQITFLFTLLYLASILDLP